MLQSVATEPVVTTLYAIAGNPEQCDGRIVRIRATVAKFDDFQVYVVLLAADTLAGGCF